MDPITPPSPDIPAIIHITGCGTEEAIGDYRYVGTFNDRPRYKHVKNNVWIRFSGIWYICDGADTENAKKFFYYTNRKTKNCTNMQWQCELDGRKPCPIVSEFSMGEVIETKVLGAAEDLWVFSSITKMHRDGTFDLFVLNHQKHRVHPEALIVDPKLCRKRRAEPKGLDKSVYDLFLCFGFDTDADLARITFTKRTYAGELRKLIGEKFSKDTDKIHLIKDGRKLDDQNPLEDKDRIIVVFGSG